MTNATARNALAWKPNPIRQGPQDECDPSTQVLMAEWIRPLRVCFSIESVAAELSIVNADFGECTLILHQQRRAMPVGVVLRMWYCTVAVP